jgi:hypothetical protein
MGADVVLAFRSGCAAMRSMKTLIAAFVTWLCGVFRVTSDVLIRDKRGNLPPPSGGIGSY